MALTKTPVCNFGEKPKNFNLLSTENKKISLDDVKGENGTLIMFICNHCPYVKAIIKDVVDDVKFLEDLGIKSVGIMSNDVKNYPEDSFENMISFSKLHNFSFPYLIDETQNVAKMYGAVCTPDFFGYNKHLELQYRGRIRELKDLKPVKKGESDLRVAMKLVFETGKGPKNQIPSMGCNIKWFK
ncbi:MAG: thioredoxin family protein [Candidatus Pelagibacterales bacterium]|nr:MAG: thioredoxin family protein [Pelagibacterales bacterium]